MELKDMKGAIILLAVIAFLGSAAAIALNDFRDSVDLPTGSDSNESVVWTNQTAVSLDQACVSGVSCNNLYNDTAQAVNLGAGNYTCSGDTITITDDGAQAPSTVYLNYSCSVADDAYNTSTSGLTGVSNTTGYLGTIGTIIGVAVLIGIVVLAFSFVRR